MADAQTFVNENREGVTLVYALTTTMLDPKLAERLTKHLCGHLDNGARALLINLDGVTRMSSIFIRSFIAAGKQAKSLEVQMCFCNVPSAIREVFELTALDQMFPIFDSEQKAINQMVRSL